MRRRGILLVLLALLATQAGCALPQGGDKELGSPDVPMSPPESGWTKERKALVLNAAVIGGIAAYGAAFWDYGSRSFRTAREGWFGANTASGGADKLGHAYSTYLATMILANAYDRFGYEREAANRLGALTSFSAFFLLEVGDGFSSHGFSGEDVVVDSTGVLLGYLRRRYPRFRDLVDYRVQYWPSAATRAGKHTDIATDYSGLKYLLALKLAGIRRLEDTPLQYAELHFGYYTRGYLTSDPEYFNGTRRVAYFGVGFNLARLFRKRGYEKIATTLDYLQIPYTYVDTGWTLD